MKALSLRQPWAWLLVEGIKTIENRKWNSKHRGRFYIHASKGMTKQEYQFCKTFCEPRTERELPDFNELLRGGIVGHVELVDVLLPPCVDPMLDEVIRWQMEDQYGFVVEEPKRIPFVECLGKLGFWTVPNDLVHNIVDDIWVYKDGSTNLIPRVDRFFVGS